MADASVRAAKPLSTIGGRWRPLAAVACVILLLLASMPTFMVLFVGLMPSIVAMIVDRSTTRYAATSVSAMNTAGVAPFVFQMWFDSHTMSGAEALLTNPIVLLVMYSAAAFGWLLYAGIPLVYVAFQQVVATRQVQALRKRQGELVDEWGDGIKVTADSAAAASRKKATG